MEKGRNYVQTACCAIFFLGSWLIANNAAAEIYYCNKNGTKEFSQQPCGEAAAVVENKVDHSLRIVVPMEDEDIERICRLLVQGWEQAVANRRETNANARYLRGNATYVSPRDYVLPKISNLREIAGTYPSLYNLILSVVGSVNVSSTYTGQDAYAYQTEHDRIEKRCNDDLRARMENGYRVRKRKAPTQ